jgi:hypothetical protein
MEIRMSEQVARQLVVDEWDLDEQEYDIEGCIEDLMDGLDIKSHILHRNRLADLGRE